MPALPVILANGTALAAVGQAAESAYVLGEALALSLQSTTGYLSFAWRLTGRPVGSTATLTSSTGTTSSLTTDVVGEYRIKGTAVGVTGTVSSTVAVIVVRTAGRQLRKVTAEDVRSRSNLTTFVAKVNEALDEIDLTARVLNVRAFGALGDGVTDDTTAIESAISACLNSVTDPTTTVRTAVRRLWFPRGTYRTTRPISLRSIVGFRWSGEDRYGTTISLDSDTLQPCVLDLNGCSYCCVEDLSFSTMGSTEATYGILLRRRLVSIPAEEPDAPAYATTTNNVLRYLWVGGKFRDAGIQIGSPGNNLQEDQTQLWGCKVVGGYTPAVGSSETTYWQHGIRFGTGVSGNNLIHHAYWCDVVSCVNGVKVWTTNVAIDGGIIQNCDRALLFTQPVGYCRVRGIRSEITKRFVEATNSGQVQCEVEIANCAFLQNADADFHTLDGLIGRWVKWDTAGTVVLRGVTAFGANPQDATPAFRPTMSFQNIHGLLAIVDACAVNNGRLADVIGLAQAVVQLRGYTETNSGTAVTSYRGQVTLSGASASDGMTSWGTTDGSASSVDTSLYRGGAGLLETAGAFKLAGTYASPLWLGAAALWVDGSGKLRVKSGTPASDSDGTIVGGQS